MSAPRITGQQARELLDGTMSGPWKVATASTDGPFDQPGEVCTGIGPLSVVSLMSQPEVCISGSTNDHALAAAAPALAETVAWLYGREPDEVGGWTDYRYDLGDGFKVDVNGPTISIGTRRLAMKFSRDEAMDLVRAVLSAVERMPAEETRP